MSLVSLNTLHDSTVHSFSSLSVELYGSTSSSS